MTEKGRQEMLRRFSAVLDGPVHPAEQPGTRQGAGIEHAHELVEADSSNELEAGAVHLVALLPGEIPELLVGQLEVLRTQLDTGSLILEQVRLELIRGEREDEPHVRADSLLEHVWLWPVRLQVVVGQLVREDAVTELQVLEAHLSDADHRTLSGERFTTVILSVGYEPFVAEMHEDVVQGGKVEEFCHQRRDGVGTQGELPRLVDADLLGNRDFTVLSAHLDPRGSAGEREEQGENRRSGAGLHLTC